MPHGSTIDERPKLCRPGSVSPICAAAATKHWFSTARARRSSSQWSLPGVQREVRRHREEQRALEREHPVELREAEVVADGQSHRPALDLGHDGLVAGLLCIRLAIDEAAGLDVEEMDLAIDGRDLAVGIEDDAGVRQLLASLAPLRDRAADERDSVRLRPAAHRLDRLAALERLGRGVQLVVVADRVPFLREDDDVGARRGCPRDEPLGLRRGWPPCRRGSSSGRTRRGSSRPRSNDSFAAWQKPHHPSVESERSRRSAAASSGSSGPRRACRSEERSPTALRVVRADALGLALSAGIAGLAQRDHRFRRGHLGADHRRRDDPAVAARGGLTPSRQSLICSHSGCGAAW